jgi:hypothetical protein
MTLIALRAGVIALIAVMIYAQRRNPRDLLHPNPNFAWSQAIRWVGNGLVFFAAIHGFALLLQGADHSLWNERGMTLIAVGLSGFAFVHATSATRHAESS